ncbi:MAG TPA: MMPL family transporter [Acidimicrobiales bacterium]|nr:MMPL family transporter [Acidimicrobiales bacterium]
MFGRLGSFCFRRRRLVAGLWLAALLVLGSVSGAVGTAFQDEFNLPNVESKTGFDILEEHFGGQGTGVTGTIVFRADQGVQDPAVRAAMEDLFAKIDARDDVTIGSPYRPEGERQIATQGPDAGKIAYAELEMPPNTDFATSFEVSEEIQAAAADIPGVQVEIGGAAFAEFAEPSSEVLGLAFAIVILILAFGSVMAMGLPVGVALAGIGVGSILIGLISNVLTLPDFATVLGIMIGLGVGIDYALFIVTRYRENLHNGHSSEQSVSIALDTAGRAVTFAGTTVVISLMGMLTMQVSFVGGLAVGAATVVFVTVIASLTLLPALLGFVGQKVEVTRWRGLIAAGLVALALVGVGLKISPLLVGLPLAAIVLVASFAYAPLRREVPPFGQKPVRETLAYRWSRFIQHRPWQTAIAGAVALLVLSIPVLSMRLGFSDEGNYDRKTTTRKAYDMLAAGFGPGFNGTFILAAELPPGADAGRLTAISDALAADPGVAFVSPAIPNDPESPAAVLWRLAPTTAPQDAATTATVNRLRDRVLPPVEASTGVDVAVTGAVPVGVDFSNYLADRLPLFFSVVLGLSFLLLMTVFRSVLVPLKAVLMNLLSIGAAYGVAVAVFQWGWLSAITGVEPAPIEPFVPMMLFAIVFGLSMDYEVFLLSRVREEWVRTGDSRTSVADGLASTARVITAAAAIMVFLFGSFLLEADRIIKLFGLGLAVAVLLDATIIRMLLVPATMELLGDKNWWMPRWLDKALPKVNVEGRPMGTEDRELEPV